MIHHRLMDETKADRRRAQKRAASTRWAAKNREYARIKTAEWRKANPERVRALVASAHAKRKENWAEFLAYERARYAKNPEKKLARQRRAKALDPEPSRKVLRNHYLRNKPAYKAACAARRAAKLQATPIWCDKRAIEDLYREAQRFTEETGIPHEVDHIIPLIGRGVCGLHIPLNMQILTRAENRRKHNHVDAHSDSQSDANPNPGTSSGL
jgi:hypothetical protein